MMRPPCLSTAVLVLLLVPWAASARPAAPAPPLPRPTGAVVNVSTEPQLRTAVQRLKSGVTIVLAPGTYRLTDALMIRGPLTDVAIRGRTGNRDDVVIAGPGMTKAGAGGVAYGIWTGGRVERITIANLTIRDVYYHPIIFNPGTERPHVYNVRLVDAGQQFIKANPGPGGGGVNGGVVEYSVIEYTRTAESDYTNGVDVHGGANWIIRHNLFRNIVAPDDRLAGPAILVWNHSRDTLVEGNTFLNCARGIAYGLDVKPGGDHAGGIIRNNVFYRSKDEPGDVGIIVSDSRETQVLNNTVFVSGTYPTPIEYRFTGATDILLANNLLDGVIGRRDGATGIERSNSTEAAAEMFVSPATGDLHLNATARAAIDRGSQLANVTDDWDGEPRPAGAASDIGAHEYRPRDGREYNPAPVRAVSIVGWLAISVVAAAAGQQTPPTRAPHNAAEFDELFQQVKNWGRWGKDDQLGSANLVTAAKRKQAISLAKTGESVSLAHNPLTERADDNASPFEHTMNRGFTTDTYRVSYHGYAHSHIDALCHILYKDQTYNGYARAEVNTEKGCTKLGIENLKNGIITRGLLIDIPRLKGVPYLEPGTPVYVEDLEAWEKKAGVKVASGDAIFLRTGRWARRVAVGPWPVGQRAAGFHASVAPWIKARGVAFVGGDAAQDVVPSMVEGVNLPVHTLLLTGLGINLLDNQDLEAVGEKAAKLNRWEFMLTIAPVPVTGGTGFPLNALATF